jgi:predicted phosphodiesterase
MLIIGDVHGKIKQYHALLEGHDQSIQVGDLGVGFVDVPRIGLAHIFLRGNHDDPQLCQKHPNYLGDWGYLKEDKIFYISGAWSIDYSSRTVGVDWWPDEELSYEELDKVIRRFEKEKPEIVISHDCPTFIKYKMGKHLFKTRTDQALQACFDVHEPKLWVYGHYHLSSVIQCDKTQFRCLNELETFRI